MYYVLDYTSFRFYSCASTDVVESTLNGLERSNVPDSMVEIILANNPDIRLNTDEFRSYNW